MGIDLSFISGVSVGIELATGQEIGLPHAKWGIAFDFLILRLVFIFFDHHTV